MRLNRTPQVIFNILKELHVQVTPDMRRGFFFGGATIHSNDGFENRRPKISKNLNFSKIHHYKYRTESDVKKQHSQSEIRAIPIYHLSYQG